MKPLTLLDREFIERKLDAIQLYYGRLQKVLESSDQQIIGDYLKLHALERLLQLVVDEMIDVNTHVIRHSDLDTPDDFQSSFRILAEGGMFPRDFADRIAPTVGLRNRLVHRYETVDPHTLVRMTRKEFDDFKTYVQHIRAHL